MAIALGIHNGHHAACALVRDGVLIAAIEQERITRIKADGFAGLSSRLPIRECLAIAGVDLSEVDVIVSSFQAIGPGGVGLRRPLIEPGFAAFDPHDDRHQVLSHHQAHALCALGSSGFRDAAIIVCDLAGSTTRDGRDFACSFAEFERSVTTLDHAAATRTECLSIYDADERRLELRHREYCVPHSAPDIFVCGAASLYDNVSRLVFGREDAHGELMALASLGDPRAAPGELSAADLLVVVEPGVVRFRNDWQHRVPLGRQQLDYVGLAAATQQALQRALLHHAIRARGLSTSDRLCGAGGVFLNIVANRAIVDAGDFHELYVPSSPHDAGIAVGCAYHGWRSLAAARGLEVTTSARKATDRLGPDVEHRIDAALERMAARVESSGPASPRDVAVLLAEGRIVARCAGRLEFGPRALGGRSLLASPLRAASKDLLNVIKGRQPWRPVAPVVPRERVGEFFVGPEESPYMNMVHDIVARHRPALAALEHPDGSARVQTLEPDDDPYLHDLLREQGALTGYPILVNTSLNGPGEPIVDSPEQAIAFFLAHPEVDLLLLGDRLVARRPAPELAATRLAPDVIASIVRPGPDARIILIRGRTSLEVSRAALERMEALPAPVGALAAELKSELLEALKLGLLVPA